MGFPLTIRLTDTKVKPWGNNGVSLLFSLASQLLFILLLSFFLSTNTKLVKLEEDTQEKEKKKQRQEKERAIIQPTHKYVRLVVPSFVHLTGMVNWKLARKAYMNACLTMYMFMTTRDAYTHTNTNTHSRKRLSRHLSIYSSHHILNKK